MSQPGEDAEKTDANKKEQLNVRIPEELLRRVNMVAGARGKSQADWVAGVLDKRTKRYKKIVAAIMAKEKEIE